jgi:hypothetical protein
MGRPAWLVGGVSQLTASTQVYLRQLHDGDYAACLFNRGASSDAAEEDCLQTLETTQPYCR